MPMTEGGYFFCAGCGGQFETENWSDELALAEMQGTYGNIPEDEREVVCDECYSKCMELLAGQQRVRQ